MLASHPSSLHRYFAECADDGLMNREVDVLRKRVVDDSPRLFRDDVDIQVLVSSQACGPHVRNERRIRNVGDLQRTWQEFTSHDYIYVLHQAFSWDYLYTDQETLFQILFKHKVSPDFLDCVHAFGKKLNDDTESWEGLHQRQQVRSVEDHGIGGYYEICYNYRYMSENGRSNGPSWSLRQTTVYQRRDLDTATTTWVFIQPSKSIKSRLAMQSTHLPLCHENAIRMHLMLLRQASEGWRGYTSYLRLALEELDEKARFAKLGPKVYQDDYDVCLKDSQALQKAQQKLFRAKTIIDATVQTVSRFRSWYDQLSNLRALDTTCADDALNELADIAATLEYSRQILKGLIAYSYGTASLLQQITSYRAMKDLQSTTSALEASLYLLRGIATTSQTQSQSMLTIAQSGNRDSLRIKTLTHIATIYLPPTLIATIFSSNLVSSKDDTGDLVVSKQFWIFVVVTAGFVAITLGGLLILERRWKRVHIP
ncbi:hypothetical protein CC86DRAFT_370430 [Ophiobolus disseminans]|uniref:CorA-like transporter domain-containing protein n=1 Tax=Ophiobolus disseminans TaxID=1469910 RepID=A0A6A6ZZD9_9PLEO|nr:hypothetical protein CC86DRAFT_370430 [Ophiobolus disseminans]